MPALTTTPQTPASATALRLAVALALGALAFLALRWFGVTTISSTMIGAAAAVVVAAARSLRDGLLQLVASAAIGGIVGALGSLWG